MLHSRYINGALAYWDTHPCRIIDAVGGSVTKYINHFTHMPLDDTTHVPGDWRWVSDQADMITLPASLTGGVMNMAVGAGGNDETYLQLGGAAVVTNAPYIIAGAAGAANTYPVYFGARVRVMEAAAISAFVGLSAEGSAAANFLTDATGALADKDLIGFNLLVATPTVWNATWRNAGNAAAIITSLATTATSWHTLEFWYDGATEVTFFADGVPHATTALTTAVTFPFNEEMAPILALKGQAAKNLQVDWMRVFQFN